MQPEELAGPPLGPPTTDRTSTEHFSTTGISAATAARCGPLRQKRLGKVC